MNASSPSYPRVLLGLAIRDRRIELKLEQEDLADVLGQRQPKISKIENALIKNIKMGELDLLLDRLKIDGAKADELRGFARHPYDERGFYFEPDGSQTWWKGVFRAEQLAQNIVSVQLETCDGLLQSEAYMRRQFDLGGRANVGAATRVRLGRQEAVFGREAPPECLFIMGEAALHRDMDDPAMMAENLAHLLAMSERENVTILIVPFNARTAPQTYGFTMMRFGSTIMTDLVFVEYGTGAMIIDGDDAVRSYTRRLQDVQGGALNEYDSRLKIRERLDHYKKALRGL